MDFSVGSTVFKQYTKSIFRYNMDCMTLKSHDPATSRYNSVSNIKPSESVRDALQ